MKCWYMYKGCTYNKETNLWIHMYTQFNYYMQYISIVYSGAKVPLK